MTRRERLALFGFALFVAVGLVPQPATAVAFLRVSYTVTGGTFNGPNLTGPITGGAVSYITNPGITAIPGTYFCYGGPCGELTRVTLTGPAGAFSLKDAIPLRALFNVLYSAHFTTVAIAGPAASAFRSGVSTPLIVWSRASVRAPYAWFGQHRDIMTHTYHLATLGAEVRTVVFPEPVPSASLLGLGLLALAIGGGGAAGARRLRRR